MKIRLAAVGKLKDTTPEAVLIGEYIKRLPWKVSVKECTAAVPEKEAAALLAACEGYNKIIALDERGQDISSRAFAGQLSSWQQQGCSSVAIVIGGADGLHESVRKRADMLIAFGRATWPHMMVRAMLVEQLYRAHTILERHPYHRD